MVDYIRRSTRHILLLMMAGIIIGVGALAWFIAVGKQSIGKTDIQVLIPRGASIAGVSHLLAKNEAIDNPRDVKWLMMLSGISPQAGLYQFSAGSTVWSVVQKMHRGDVSPFSITIPEGMLTSDIIRRLQNNDFLTGQIKGKFKEGSLLPETYYVDYGTDRTTMLKRMQSDMAKQVADIWAGRDKSIPLKSPRDMVILASIVEMETPIHGEKPVVAGVYLNRIKKRMRLNADPTVAYGIYRGKKKLDRPLWFRDLKKPSPYNTYLNYGLPPTPSANPGRQSLMAVAHPKKTNYLYFVADGTGGHVFAKTYAQHKKNVAKWRRINRK